MTSAQLKVTLPTPLHGYLKSKADYYGLNMASYVKNLIINDARNDEYQARPASPQIEKSYKKALKERKRAIGLSQLF